MRLTRRPVLGFQSLTELLRKESLEDSGAHGEHTRGDSKLLDWVPAIVDHKHNVAVLAYAVFAQRECIAPLRPHRLEVVGSASFSEHVGCFSNAYRSTLNRSGLSLREALRIWACLWSTTLTVVHDRIFWSGWYTIRHLVQIRAKRISKWDERYHARCVHYGCAVQLSIGQAWLLELWLRCRWEVSKCHRCSRSSNGAN